LAALLAAISFGFRLPRPNLHQNWFVISKPETALFSDLRFYVGRSDAITVDEIGARYELTNHQRSMVLDEKSGSTNKKNKG
jgi:hypothetical protein